MKYRENKFFNIDRIEIMMLRCYSVMSGVSIPILKVSLSCILIEIPGGMYTPPAVLIMKIIKNDVFLVIFCVNGGRRPLMCVYVMTI